MKREEVSERGKNWGSFGGAFEGIVFGEQVIVLVFRKFPAVPCSEEMWVFLSSVFALIPMVDTPPFER